MGFLDHLAVGAVEDRVVNVLERKRHFGVSVRMAIETGGLLSLGMLAAISRVSSVDRRNVSGNRERSVNLGVLRIELGLVEIVGVHHVRAMNSCDFQERMSVRVNLNIAQNGK